MSIPSTQHEGAMTLDEAIQHALEAADRLEKSDACANGACAFQHRQLAGWLQELKDLKEATK